MILDPQPVVADTIEFPYTLFFDNLRLETGTCTSVDGTTGLLDSTLNNLYPNDYFNGWIIKIISGTGRNSYAIVTGYVGGTCKFTVADWLFSNGVTGGTDPAASSIYVVQPAASLHPAGLRFDEAIKSACLAQTEMEIEDVASGYVQKYAQKDLAKAYSIDTRSAPKKLGSMNKGSFQERTWKDVTYS